MVFEFLKRIFSNLSGKSLFLNITILVLVVVVIVLLINVLKNSAKRKNEILEKYADDLFSELKNITYLWKNGVISRNDYEDKKKNILGNRKKIDQLIKKIFNHFYLDNYSKSLNELGQGIIILREGRIKYVSKMILEILGYSRKNMASKKLAVYVYPADQDALYMELYTIKELAKLTEYSLADQCLNENIEVNKVFRLLSNGGDIKWFEISSTTINEKKKIAICFFKDLTWITQVESELVEALDCYYNIFENSLTSFWKIDISDLKDYIFKLQTSKHSHIENSFNYNQHIFSQCISSIKIINLNKDNLGLLNVSNKSRLIENMFKLISNDFKDIFIKLFKAISISGLSDESEINYKTFSGKEKYAIAKFTIVKNKSGVDSSALLFIHDITDQKLMIKKIQDFNQFNENIIDDANAWFSVFDDDFNVLVWNKVAEQISGYSKEEVIGINNIWGWLYPNGKEEEEVKNKITSFNRDGIVSEFETTIKCKDGASKVVLFNTKKFTDAINKKTTLICIGYDYTEKKKREEKITHIAVHDSLTNLYNRTFFEEHLALMFKERDIRIGIIIIDIDGLKYVNDTVGHQQGDRLIIGLSRILGNIFRPSDIICRIGGDEFAVLLRNIDEHQIQNAHQRLKSKIEDYNNDLLSNRYPLSISFGYSIKDHYDKTALYSFKEADDMLFENKVLKKESVIKSILNAIQNTVLEKDQMTDEHVLQLKTLALDFAQAMGFDSIKKDNLISTMELHDIGKVEIPSEILVKDSELESNEFEIIKKHPKSGFRIASLTPNIKNISEYILYTHERWDGKGYPGGLKGEEIPVISRMVHLIDAYDAIISDRPYKKAKSREFAIAELIKCSGGQFDPYLVDVFINKVLRAER